MRIKLSSLLTVEKGITGFDEEKGQLTRQFIKNAKQSIVLSDQSKFGLVQFYKIADLIEIDIIMSDAAAPKE